MSFAMPLEVTRSIGHGVSSSQVDAITIAADSEGTADQRVKDAFFIVEPKQKQLVEVAKQLDAGYLRAFVKTAVPLNEASAAYRGAVRDKRGRSSSPFPPNPARSEVRLSTEG